MQHYLNQLLADLRDRHDKQPPPLDYRLLHPQYADVPDEMKYAVEWEQAPEQTFEQLLGLSADVFPPAEQLTETQMLALLEGICDLWAAWRIFPDPVLKEVPVENAYRVVRVYWREQSIIYVSEGNTHLEFCHYEPAECPWGSAYCSCKDFDYDVDEDTDMPQPF